MPLTKEEFSFLTKAFYNGRYTTIKNEMYIEINGVLDILSEMAPGCTAIVKYDNDSKTYKLEREFSSCPIDTEDLSA